MTERAQNLAGRSEEIRSDKIIYRYVTLKGRNLDPNDIYLSCSSLLDQPRYESSLMTLEVSDQRGRKSHSIRDCVSSAEVPLGVDSTCCGGFD